EPTSVAWLCQGRPATHAEVLDSLEGGLTFLRGIAASQKGGLEALEASYALFKQYLPAPTLLEAL
ncbi:MAG: hypothetical protein ABW123_11660, partial [Cystobacter sp.]